jgi:hypothetical protein
MSSLRDHMSAGASTARAERESEVAEKLKSVRAKRKRLKKMHPGSHWIGGVLHLPNGRGYWYPIEGVERFPKPGNQAIGLQAGDGPPLKQPEPEPSWRAGYGRPYWDRMGPYNDGDRPSTRGRSSTEWDGMDQSYPCHRGAMGGDDAY